MIAGPVRIPHGGINLKKLIVGARVHVFVNAVPKISFDATAKRCSYRSGLSREAVVTAKQAMCTKISDESNPEAAQLGELRVDHSPKPITRTKSTSITVSANDRENDQPIIGNVKIGGAVVGKSERLSPTRLRAERRRRPGWMPSITRRSRSTGTWSIRRRRRRPRQHVHR